MVILSKEEIKKQILEEFKDINYAYNNATKYDTLERMLNELIQDSEPIGYWIDRSNGGRILYPWMENGECCKCGSFGSRGWNFCPICGLKMKGGI